MHRWLCSVLSCVSGAAAATEPTVGKQYGGGVVPRKRTKLQHALYPECLSEAAVSSSMCARSLNMKLKTTQTFTLPFRDAKDVLAVAAACILAFLTEDLHNRHGVAYLSDCIQGRPEYVSKRRFGFGEVDSHRKLSGQGRFESVSK